MNKEYKIAFLGDAAVGKTSIVKKYLFDVFYENPYATIGASFYQKKINHKYKNKDHEILLHIWDTAGEDKFQSIVPLYTKKTYIFIIVFDLQKTKNIIEYINKWYDFIKENNYQEHLIYLVGNKYDLGDYPEIDYNKFKIENIFYISALTGQNINKLFNDILNDIAKHQIKNEKNNIINIVPLYDEKITLKNKKCCF